MNRGRRAFVAAAALTVLASPARVRAEEAPDLPLVRDLQADAQEARKKRVPLLVLFSLPGCPYCNAVRREHLLPMLRDPATASRAIFRQVNLGSDERLIDFDGHTMTHDALARRSDVRAVPVVAFWDAGGRAVADPIKGMLLADFYGAYLEDALAKARERVAAPR